MQGEGTSFPRPNLAPRFSMQPKLLLVLTLLAACDKSRVENSGNAPESTSSDKDSLSIVEQFAGPESMQYYPAADEYFVSNVNGDMTIKDDNGFISRIAPDGHVIQLKWIDGASLPVTLHAPKGMVMRHDTLFVADIDSIRAFVISTGSPAGSIAIPGARFLNGLALSPDGVLYATDSGLKTGMLPTATDAVYRIDTSGPVVVAEGPWLSRPNGIKVGSEGVTVVTFGSKVVLRLKVPNTGPDTVATLMQGSLDGLVRLDEDRFLVTSWDGKAIYLVDLAAKRSHPLVLNVAGAADIGYDTKRKRVLIPLVSQNRLEIRKAP